MIYLGVDLSYQMFDISIVSNGYACLERSKTFCRQDEDSIKSWIKLFMLSDNEDVIWFFREKNYLSTDYSSSFLFTDFGQHFHFLVKDRIILDYYHAIKAVNEAHDNRVLLDISLILALSKRLFDTQYIVPYGESGQLKF